MESIAYFTIAFGWLNISTHSFCLLEVVLSTNLPENQDQRKILHTRSEHIKCQQAPSWIGFDTEHFH